MKQTFVVIAREDRSADGEKGPFTLATRQIFLDEGKALRYANGISDSREATVVPGDWQNLRKPRLSMRLKAEGQ